MRGHYGMGSSETILDQDLSTLFKTNRIDDLIMQLQLHVKKFIVDSDDIRNKGTRSPFFSMLYFVLKMNGAKDWLTGLLLSDKHVGRSHSLQYHHIFPKSLLRTNFDKKEINEIANLAFIGGKTNRQITNKEPKFYFEDIIQKRGQDALISQLIPMEKACWEISEYKRFLEFRRKQIAEAIQTFMEKYE